MVDCVAVLRAAAALVRWSDGSGTGDACKLAPRLVVGAAGAAGGVCAGDGAAAGVRDAVGRVRQDDGGADGGGQALEPGGGALGPEEALGVPLPDLVEPDDRDAEGEGYSFLIWCIMRMEPQSEETSRHRGWWWMVMALPVIYLASSAPVEIWCLKHGYGRHETVWITGNDREDILLAPNWVRTLYAPVASMTRWKPLEEPINIYFRWWDQVLSPAPPSPPRIDR